MNLDDAYNMIDLLLDEADLPYFSNEEKHKFLGLSISDFINMHYQKMTSDEDSRRALSGCIDWKGGFSLSPADIIAGTYVYDDRYPGLSEKYTSTGISGITAAPTRTNGFFKFGNAYVLPEQHLYVLAMAIKTYNKEDIIDPDTGLAYSGVAEDDIIISKTVSVKNKSTRDYYEDVVSSDPFNKPTKEDPNWNYIENRIHISPGSNIIYMNIQVITLPTVDQAFSESTNSGTNKKLVFADHYKTQIIQAAVSKMSKNIDLHN